MRRVAYLGLFTNGLINHIMIGDDLLLCGEIQVLHSSVLLLQIDVAQTTIEEHFAGVELELEAELLIVDVVVSAEVEEGVVEVCEGLFEVAHEEVGYTLLEVSYSQVLVQLHGALVVFDLCLLARGRGPTGSSASAYSLLVLGEGRMDDTAVEEDFGGIGNVVKLLQCLVVLIIIVVCEGCHPGLDFLPRS